MKKKSGISAIAAFAAIVASGAIDDGAFIHLDAAGSKFGIVVSNGVCHVSHWYDVRGFSYRSAVAQAPGPSGFREIAVMECAARLDLCVCIMIQ